ncbi:MAG: hypothetical protein F4Y69_06245 [Chloroflexi bacterium]|nr:hypothetical protein [Chloroflexota bacterium]MYD15998.1 hypothetical protein [Chloroflexota bacterium]MYG34639.1 hypothetical protein [Gemmatimonadota bacterium]
MLSAIAAENAETSEILPLLGAPTGSRLINLFKQHDERYEASLRLSESPKRISHVSALGWQRHYQQAGWTLKIEDEIPSLSRSLRAAAVEAIPSIWKKATALRALELPGIADQIEELIEDEQEDPENARIDAESMGQAITFLLLHPELPHPDIGLRRGGIVDFGWHVQPDGVMSLSFDADGSMNFATNVPGRDIEDRQRISGTTSSPEVVACVIGRLLEVEGAE